jgi:hypothetical protein
LRFRRKRERHVNKAATSATATRFLGDGVLSLNTTGSFNTANGYQALFSNTTGSLNTANGYSALLFNTTGIYNTASGENALVNNTTGSNNTAIGANTLAANTTGVNNTAIGLNALVGNTTGNNNIALGFRAGFNLTTGDRNIDIGNGGLAGESSTIRIGRRGDRTATFIAGISGATVATGVAVIVDADGHLGTTPLRHVSRTQSSRWIKRAKPSWPCNR